MSKYLAHEQYVLPQEIFTEALDIKIKIWDALKQPANLKLGLIVAAATLTAILIYTWFAYSKFGVRLNKNLNQWDNAGWNILRITTGIVFLFSAYYKSYLGPEVPLEGTIGFVLQASMVVLGVLLIFGKFNHVAASLGLVSYGIMALFYPSQIPNYFNYVGIFIALLVSSIYYKAFIVRIAFGFSIIYAAITIKLLHPAITVEVANRYNLMQFNWLFPSDPLLIAFGTGIAELLLGGCLILGFATRLNAVIAFTLYTLSLLFFREALWPHLVLFALAIYLFINNGGGYSLDNLLANRKPGLDKRN